MKLKGLGSSKAAKKAEAAEKAKVQADSAAKTDEPEVKEKPVISNPVPDLELDKKEVVKNAIVPVTPTGPAPLPPAKPVTTVATLPPPTVAKSILAKALETKKRKDADKKEKAEAIAREIEAAKAAAAQDLPVSEQTVGDMSQKAVGSMLGEVGEMKVGDLAHKAAGVVLKGTIQVAQHGVDAAAHVAVEQGLVTQEQLGTVGTRQATAAPGACSSTEVIPRAYTLTNLTRLSFGEGITVPDKRPYLVTRSLAQGLTGKLFTFTHKAIWGCSTNLPMEGPLRLISRIMGKCWTAGSSLPVDHLAFVARGQGKVAGAQKEVFFVAQFGSPDIWGTKDEIPFRALLKEGKKKYAVMAMIQGPGNMDVWIVHPAMLRKRYVFRDQRVVHKDFTPDEWDPLRRPLNLEELNEYIYSISYEDKDYEVTMFNCQNFLMDVYDNL